MALMIDAGAQTTDPCECPNGGDHDFQDKPIGEEMADAFDQIIE